MGVASKLWKKKTDKHQTKARMQTRKARYQENQADKQATNASKQTNKQK